jgi:hypothetical protein
LQEKLNTAISPGNADTRVPAAKAVTEGWQDSLPVLIQNISTYYQSDGKSYSHETIAKLLPLTDLLVSIVETKDGAIEKFREVDTSETVDVLTLAAASDDRDLRLNASSVLYKVVDDDNLCIVFHRLRDPKLGSSGQLNLLQIAVWGANTAARENLQAAKETAEKLKASAEENPNQTSGDGDRALYVNTLDSLASGRESAWPNRCLQTATALATTSIRALPYEARALPYQARHRQPLRRQLRPRPNETSV